MHKIEHLAGTPVGGRLQNKLSIWKSVFKARDSLAKRAIDRLQVLYLRKNMGYFLVFFIGVQYTVYTYTKSVS